MKKLSKFASLFAMLFLASCFFACKPESDEVPKDETDTTAPANVTELSATARDSRVLLTWTDATDDDIFGYEVSYSGTNTINRAVSAMEKSTLFVAQGAGGTYVSGLENETEYTFTVKTMDTSGNKSEGAAVKATPSAPDKSDPLRISLSAAVPTKNAYTDNYTGNRSNTTITVYVDITSANTVKKVVYSPNYGIVNARYLLSAERTEKAEKVGSDDKKWTFVISAADETANCTYTVAAIDEAGREDAMYIWIGNPVDSNVPSFDFTAPAKVTNINGTYQGNSINLTWKEPNDSDFDHVKITYTSNDGTSDSEKSEPIEVKKGTTAYVFNDIDTSKEYYTYYLVSGDSLGNEGLAREYRVYVEDKKIEKVPEGFVFINRDTYSGKETWTPNSNVFASGREITIRNLIVCDHEVTQKEYKTYCSFSHSTVADGEGDNFPEFNLTWYDAVLYCNLRSMAENLTPVYKLGDETNPKNWPNIKSLTTEKYAAPALTKEVNEWDKITMDIEANGYRLPTEAEWEYLARGGETTSTTYSGSNTIDDVAWYESNSDDKYHEIKTKKPNNLGLYDMSGNAPEWCWDWYANSISKDTPETGADSSPYSYRCYRGGGKGFTAYYCTVDFRSSNNPLSCVGLRVVRTVK